MVEFAGNEPQFIEHFDNYFCQRDEERIGMSAISKKTRLRRGHSFNDSHGDHLRTMYRLYHLADRQG